MTMCCFSLQEIGKPDPPLLQKLRSEFGYHAFGRQGWHSGLGKGECLEKLVSEVIELGISLSYAKGTPWPKLHQRLLKCIG